MIYENLLLNSSFESGTTGWATINGANSVVTSSTTQSFSAEKSALVTYADPGGGTITTPGIFSSGGSYRPNVIAGEVYTLSAYVKSINANAIPLLARVYIYNSGGSVQTYSPASTLTNVTSSSEWTRVSTTITVPATGALARVGFYHDTATVAAVAGDGFYIDAVKFEKNSEPTQYVEELNQTQETDAVNDAMRPLLSGDIETRPYITGLKLQGDVSINGLLLNTIDENKVVWVCTDITGWWTLPAPEVPNIARGLDDGSYDVRGRWLPRDITLTGSILPPTPGAAPAARETLLEALDLVYTGGWLKVDEGPVKSCFVRIVGQPQITSVNARGRIDFSVQLRAGDPIKYSWDTDADDGYTTSGLEINTTKANTMYSTDITNAGNTNTAPIFSITGPMTAPAYIKNVTTGKTIKIVKNLRPNSFSSAITTKISTSGIATMTTSAAHGFLVGDGVTIASIDTHTFLNGAKTITDVTSTTFSFADTGVEVTTASLTSNVVTLTTAANHGFSGGNTVYVSGLGIPFDGTYTTSTASGTTITYAKVYANTDTTYEGRVYLNITSTADAATATLTAADTLEIDTYNTTVLYRGLPDAARSTLDAGVDWIKLQPGINVLRLEKSNASVTPASVTIKYKSGWIS
jgi:hypothetical protein